MNLNPVLPDLGRCPNCRGVRFYVEPDGTLVFLHLACDGRAFSTAEGHAELNTGQGGLDTGELFCTGCGWHGGPDELTGCPEGHALDAVAQEDGGRD